MRAPLYSTRAISVSESTDSRTLDRARSDDVSECLPPNSKRRPASRFPTKSVPVKATLSLSEAPGTVVAGSARCSSEVERRASSAKREATFTRFIVSSSADVVARGGGTPLFHSGAGSSSHSGAAGASVP